MRLTEFDALTFDCYGTLIDWETGIFDALAPWLERHGVAASAGEVLEAFAQRESKQQADTPDMVYPEILARVHTALAEHWGISSSDAEAREFGASVGNWPAFADAPEALGTLKEHFKLVILSNVDRTSFKASNDKLGVEFDAVFTAQDVGSYKPDPRNFAALLDGLKGLGIEAKRILHTAQSLFHDHVPAGAAGLATAWINRRHDQEGWGATMPVAQAAQTDFHFTSLAEMVERLKADLVLSPTAT
ncbi:MAG: haloacid dehalogenase type II [Rhodospirillales bacterium]|jgi:2-haloalkanoic acid dehalogenase type II|nr:haloacid dehalogenase type II [Rhodospirillales bacterium]MDP7651547.1 haloacid dehalogenase type II [Rhodospirillales bacterium]